MATYYPTSSSHQTDMFPNSYISNDSFQESPLYVNRSSTDTSFLELLCGNLQSNPQILSQVDNSNNLDDEHNLNYQELSLNLEMQLPSSSMDLHTFQYSYSNSHLPNSSNHGFQTKKAEHNESSSFNFIGTVKNEAINNDQYLISNPYDGSYGILDRILDPMYLKPSQELLKEVVNLHEALSQLKMNKHNSQHNLSADEKGSSFTPHESTANSSAELSGSEKQNLQNKVRNLFSLLDKVYRKYKEYYQQLRIVEATLDAVSGYGASRIYTALAHQTISCHFRCLRDAINGQIQLTRQSLGQQDDSSDRVLPRLRNVEKRIRQQRNLGGTRHSWKPQRGLPEFSVSILRSWLFEHFLNPYPKDSEKLLLAKQTGLTRSQITYWFINARVRLWKPMIEDIYKEEFGDAEVNCVSSHEHSSKSLNDNLSSSEYKELPIIYGSSDSNPEFLNQMEVSRFSEPQLLSDFLV